MLRIPCLFCGIRDHTEFRYGGDAGKSRPAHGTTDADEWHDYVFLFDNPRGLHREYWQHVLGCRLWLIVERDTGTNTLLHSRLANEAAP